jgi:hypothetical protein
MASIISAGTTDATSLNVSSDKTGILQLASNNAVTAVTIDASQNVGIGVTPAAFADKVVQVGSTGALAGSASYGSILSNNIYWSVAGFSTAKYITTGYGSYYYQDQTGKHTWASIPSGTAGTSATATNGMTLDNNNVLYLPNAPTGDAHVKIQQGAVTTLGAIGSSGLLILGGGSNNNLCQIGLGYTGSYSPTAISSITTTQTGYTIADLIFATRNVNTDTAPTERMRIDSSGNMGINTSSPAHKLDVQSNVEGAIVRILNNRDTTGSFGIKVTLGSSGGAGTTGSAHFHGNTNAVGNWYLYGNGTTSYSSDQRLKKNIETTRDGYLEDLARLRVVKFNWNVAAEGAPKELGLIAQEVEQVFPGLVQDDANPVTEGDDTVYKQLKQSVLPFMLLKAIQELKVINDTQAETINALTARIEALENK